LGLKPSPVSGVGLPGLVLLETSQASGGKWGKAQVAHH